MQKLRKFFRTHGPSRAKQDWWMTTRSATQGRGIDAGRPVQLFAGKNWTVSLIPKRTVVTYVEFREGIEKP